MWRICALALLGGCNALFGVHELAADARIDSNIDADPCVAPCECHVDEDCAGSGAHYVCVNDVTSRTCECAAGYTAGAGGACYWTGVVQNPGFATTMAWTPVGGAGINTTGSGSVNPGYAVLDDASCTDDVGVVQMVTMPRLASAEPLIVEAVYEQTPGGENGGGSVAPTLGIVTDDEFGYVPAAWTVGSACLGAGQYAPATSTGLGAAMPLSVYENCGGIYLDHIDVEPAPANACAAPGTVLNGDCSGSNGWTFSTPGTGSDATKAAYVTSGGYQNGPGVELFVQGLCDSASASTVMSPPLADSTGSPVLSFYHSTAQSYFTVTSDGLPFRLTGAMPTVERYCLPGYMRGGYYDITTAIPLPGGLCATNVDDEAIIGAFTVSNDPVCGSDAYFADPGFESGLSLIGASQSYGAVSVVADSGTGTDPTPTPAHHLQLAVDATCGEASLADRVVVPPVSGSSGPAVTFWYNYVAGTNTSLTVPSYMTLFTPTRDGTWHQGVACLDPNRVGRVAAFSFGVSATGTGSCGTGFTTETLLIDDLSATTSASCPTQ